MYEVAQDVSILTGLNKCVPFSVSHRAKKMRPILTGLKNVSYFSLLAFPQFFDGIWSGSKVRSSFRQHGRFFEKNGLAPAKYEMTLSGTSEV